MSVAQAVEAAVNRLPGPGSLVYVASDDGAELRVTITGANVGPRLGELARVMARAAPGLPVVVDEHYPEGPSVFVTIPPEAAA